MKCINKKAVLNAALAASLLSPLAKAQSDVWSGLVRSQFDSPALTLRIPCAIVEDENGNAVQGLAPAYALNLLLSSDEPENESFRLVEPIMEFSEIPESCLDTLVVRSDLTTATYTTSSTEIDADAMANADRFYTLELEANLLTDGPIEFSVVSASSRLYRRPIYTGDSFLVFIGIPPFGKDFIFDDDFLDGVYVTWQQGLVVFEAGQLEIDCFYEDPFGLLELFETIGTNERYRLKDSVSAADNGKELLATCTAFNHDINRLERTVSIFSWTINL